MSFKVAIKVVSCIVFASLCAFGASQSGEKFKGSNLNDCGVVDAAPEVQFNGNVEFADGKVSIHLQPVAAGTAKLYYTALLVTDLTQPLDEAASSAGNKKGFTIVKNIDYSSVSSSNNTISIDVDARGKGNRYYVAVAAYRCNWNARDNNGNLSRSGWKLWTSNGVPQMVSTT